MSTIWQRLRRLPTLEKIFWIGLFVCMVGSIIWVNHNDSFYQRTIAQVERVEEVGREKVSDHHGNHDEVHEQLLIARITNGQDKGREIELPNTYSIAKAYDFPYKVGSRLFVTVNNQEKTERLSGSILDMKRDTHLVAIAWLFIFILVIIGRRQGLFSMVGLFVNVLILSYALDIQMSALQISLVWVMAGCAILFTVLSLLLVNGFNEKTYTAIVVTFLGTASSLLITYLLFSFTGGAGLRYEEMEYLTRTYELVFMAGLFIGSLGAVMDIGITMAAAMFEMYEENQSISVEQLKQSGREVGKDIMGAMTNILFFAYVSGAIPTLILYLKNGAPIGFTLQMNISLELARALSGAIGVVLAIPIALYTSLYFVSRKKRSSV